MKTKALMLVGLWAGALWAPLGANALPITLTYNGTCSFNCEVIGLHAGDSVSGFISTVDGLNDDILWASELTDFGFTFGNLVIAPTTHFAAGALSLTQNLLEGLRFESYNKFWGIAISAANTGSLLGLSGWTARPGLSLQIAAGPGNYSYDPVSVPEPSVLSLLGLGIFLLGIMHRRRRPV